MNADEVWAADVRTMVCRAVGAAAVNGNWHLDPDSIMSATRARRLAEIADELVAFILAGPGAPVPADDAPF